MHSFYTSLLLIDKPYGSLQVRNRINKPNPFGARDVTFRAMHNSSLGIWKDTLSVCLFLFVQKEKKIAMLLLSMS